MKDLYIIGAGGFGREVAWLVERINGVCPTWNIKGFIDDNEDIYGKQESKYKVLGNCNYLKTIEDAYVVCAVGSARIRKGIIEQVSEGNQNLWFATLIDPSVLISDSVQIGEGTIICAGTIATVNINIGKHVIINLDCTIGHDAIIENYVTVYPSVNISGCTQIGVCTELGTGVQIIQGKTVGDESIIGAGAVVIRDIPGKCTAVGSPAKPIKFFDEYS